MSLGILATQSAYRQHLIPVADALGVGIYGSTRSLGEHPLWLVASHRDFVALGSRRRRVVMEHGCGLERYGGSKLRRLGAAAAIAAPNEYVAGWFRDLPTRVEVVGTPKMDELARHTSRVNQTVCVSFHWSGVRGRPAGATQLERYRAAVAELNQRVLLIGHAHPRIWDLAARFYAELGIEAVRSFDEVVARAGTYICDHSSTLYEWAAIGRPVVLLDPAPRAARFSGLRYEMHRGIGPEVGPDELVDLFPLTDTWTEERRVATEDLYPYRGEATARVVALLEETGEG